MKIVEASKDSSGCCGTTRTYKGHIKRLYEAKYKVSTAVKEKRSRGYRSLFGEFF